MQDSGLRQWGLAAADLIPTSKLRSLQVSGLPVTKHPWACSVQAGRESGATGSQLSPAGLLHSTHCWSSLLSALHFLEREGSERVH